MTEIEPIIDLNKAEAIIRKEELIPREVLKTGDIIKPYCYDVIRENKGQQIFLSRANPKFMEKLFFQEVSRYCLCPGCCCSDESHTQR